MIYFFKKTQNLHFLKSTVYSWSVPLCLFRIKCITQKNNALNILCTICFCYCSIIIIFPISTIKMIFSFLWSNFILKVILSIRSHTLLWGYLLGCFIWNTESLKSQFSWAGCSHITASLSNSECRVILVQCPNFTPLKNPLTLLQAWRGNCPLSVQTGFHNRSASCWKCWWNVQGRWKESVNEVTLKLEEQTAPSK